MHIQTLLTCTGALHLSAVEQLLQKLPKTLIFSKDRIHLSRVIGQGMYKNRHVAVASSLGYKQVLSCMNSTIVLEKA